MRNYLQVLKIILLFLKWSLMMIFKWVTWLVGIVLWTTTLSLNKIVIPKMSMLVVDIVLNISTLSPNVIIQLPLIWWVGMLKRVMLAVNLVLWTTTLSINIFYFILGDTYKLLIYSLYCLCLCVPSFEAFPVFPVFCPIPDFYAEITGFYANIPCYLGFYTQYRAWWAVGGCR